MTRRAFIAGISRYARPGQLRDLWGVANDVPAWTSLVRDLGGVDAGNIRLLADDRCTAQGIMERLAWLFDGAAAGDEAYFIYCGHGAEVSTRDASGAPSGTHECLVPFDFSFDAPETALTGDVLAARIAAHNKVGVAFTCIFDCCHAGGLSRDASLGPAPFAIDMPRVLEPPHDVAFRKAAARAIGAPGTRVSGGLAPLGTCIFACQEEELAWETWVNGQFRGVFSFAVEAALRAGKTSLESVVTAALGTIKDRGFVAPRAQTPWTNRPERTLF